MTTSSNPCGNRAFRCVHWRSRSVPEVIAPDPDYSTPGHTRILHYRRPTGPFAQFEKQDYLIPTEHILPLATALLQQPDQLPQFEPHRQPTEHIRELMVCTHGNVDVACAPFIEAGVG